MRFVYANGSEIGKRHVENFSARNEIRRQPEFPPSLRMLFGISEEAKKKESPESDSENTPSITKEPQFKIKDGIRGELNPTVENKLQPYFNNRKFSKFHLERICSELILQSEDCGAQHFYGSYTIFTRIHIPSRFFCPTFGQLPSHLSN
eukprot:UN24372